MKTTSTKYTARLLAAAGMVISVACTERSTSSDFVRDGSADSTRAMPDMSVASSAEARAPAPARFDAPSVGLKAAAEQGPDQTKLPDVVAAASMIIRNGNASVLVDSLELAIARVTAMAARLGGFVANTQVQSGNTQVPSATIELKLPAARYQEAADALAPLGKVEYVNTTAQDVGEEYVDVTARMANARRLEDRLVQLLAQRTGKLEDVLNVERELARVREEIERYEGRLRYLRSRVAMSTLTITVHEKAPIVSPNPDENVLGTAVTKAWRNFVYFSAGLIAALGWVIPAGGILVGLAWLGRRALRVRRTARAPLTPAVPNMQA